MNTKFYHNYKLKKNTPKYNKGWPLTWNGSGEKFYFKLPSEWKHDNVKPSIYSDFESNGYTVDEIQNKEFFEPVGKERDFIPSFPDKEKIKEYVYLEFETRLVDCVDECRAMNKLFDSNEFKNDLYNFVKTKYNKFHKLK